MKLGEAMIYTGGFLFGVAGFTAGAYVAGGEAGLPFFTGFAGVFGVLS